MKASKAKQSDAMITIVVVTSRGREHFTFSKTAKIEDVIAKVREHFELTGEGTFELIRGEDSETLEGNRPLVSYAIEDGDEFILTSGGRNVAWRS